MRPVLMEDPSELDSLVMTIRHRAVAIQAFRALWRSELKRVGHPLSQLGDMSRKCHPEPSGRPQSGRPRRRRTPCSPEAATAIRGVVATRSGASRELRSVFVMALCGHGVHCAQDDKRLCCTLLD